MHSVTSMSVEQGKGWDSLQGLTTFILALWGLHVLRPKFVRNQLVVTEFAMSPRWPQHDRLRKLYFPSSESCLELLKRDKLLYWTAIKRLSDGKWLRRRAVKSCFLICKSPGRNKSTFTQITAAIQTNERNYFRLFLTGIYEWSLAHPALLVHFHFTQSDSEEIRRQGTAVKLRRFVCVKREHLNLINNPDESVTQIRNSYLFVWQINYFLPK